MINHYKPSEIISIPHISIARAISNNWFIALMNFFGFYCLAQFPEVFQLDFGRISEEAPKIAIALLILAVIDALFLHFSITRIMHRRQPFLLIDNSQIIINSLVSSRHRITLPMDEIKRICFGKVSFVAQGITTRKNAVGIEKKPSDNFKLTPFEKYNLSQHGFHIVILEDNLEFDAKRLADLIAERASLPVLPIPEK
ncbi:hypothetical protein ACQU0X_13695 [Pseudovibrio ascidiaceicola]|uniref:hypothetical protein n=1 Tax=Pseudovibrio ascidiaceicola TaxID=285279 RepID=UPI003D36C94A